MKNGYLFSINIVLTHKYLNDKRNFKLNINYVWSLYKQKKFKHEKFIIFQKNSYSNKVGIRATACKSCFAERTEIGQENI